MTDGVLGAAWRDAAPRSWSRSSDRDRSGSKARNGPERARTVDRQRDPLLSPDGHLVPLEEIRVRVGRLDGQAALAEDLPTLREVADQRGARGDRRGDDDALAPQGR